MKRVGIDIGGTFTDLLVLDEQSGQVVARHKLLSTPSSPDDAAIAGLRESLATVDAETDPQISFVCHATTVITNALLQHATAHVGLITTAGFRDVLEIARMVRPTLFDLNVERMAPLIPRRDIAEVVGRTDALGREVVPLDLGSVDAAIDYLLDRGVVGIAICLINAYADGTHEDRIAERIRVRVPDLPVTLSSALVPEFREYRRLSTTVVNAATMPVFAGYIDRMSSRLADIDEAARLYLMSSSGGMTAADAARSQPVRFVESGPAAGVVAAARLAVRMGRDSVIAFDMGGTTAKAALIKDGQPLLANAYSVGGARHGRSVGASNEGYLIGTPVINLVEIGAGGGSIAYADRTGALHVGPRSAGANPGPICYGRGGEEPTVTDAHVVTGVIDPANFLGGRMQLDADAAERGMRRLADTVGMGVTDLASGIIEIADAAMLAAIRVVTVERGVDPRRCSLVGFGGAGPMRACALGAALGVESVIIPPEPGLFSAMGLLATDIRRESARSSLLNLAQAAAEQIVDVYAPLVAQADEGLRDEGIAPADRRIVCLADMRYRGQSHELRVEVPWPITEDVVDVLRERFHDAHKQRFGHADPNAQVQFVTARVSAVGRVAPMGDTVADRGDGDASRARTRQRPVQLSRHVRVNVPVYDRRLLRAGDRFYGPAVVEEFDSTVLVLDTQRVTVDPTLALVVTPKAVS